MVLLGTIGKALFLIFAGILLLRIAGRKTISQMTLPETTIDWKHLYLEKRWSSFKMDKFKQMRCVNFD